MWESEVNAGPSVGRRPETKPGCIFPTIFKSPAGKYRPSFHPRPQGVLDFLLLLSQDPGFLSSSCRARAARGFFFFFEASFGSACSSTGFLAVLAGTVHFRGLVMRGQNNSAADWRAPGTIRKVPECLSEYKKKSYYAEKL